MAMNLKKLDTCDMCHLWNQKYRFLLLPTNPDLEQLQDDQFGLFAIAEIAQLLAKAKKLCSLSTAPTPTFIMRWINKDLHVKHTKTAYLYSIPMVSLALGIPTHQVRKYLEGNYIRNPLSVASRPYSIHITEPEIPILQTRVSLLQLTILGTRLDHIKLKPRKEIQDYGHIKKYRSWERPTGLSHFHRTF